MNVDFNGDLTPTPERRENYYMSQYIAERSLRIYTLDNSGIKTETDINGHKIGFFSGTITNESIKKYYPLSFDTVRINSFSEVAEKLMNGEIDAFVSESIADPGFAPYDFIHSRAFFALAYESVSLSTANPKLRPIISVVNKYLAAGGTNKVFEIYKNGEKEYFKYKLNNSFTSDEKNYINNLKVNNSKVLIAKEYDNYPICFYNKKDKEFQGIAVDVLNEVTELTGIEFEAATEESDSWLNILEKLKSGEISMVTELLYSNPRKIDYIWANTPISTSYYALLSKSDFPNMQPGQISGAAVGAMEGSLYDVMYRRWFPENDNLITFDNQYDAFSALENGDIDLLMASEIMLRTQTNYLEKPGYKVNISLNTTIESIFGFNKNEELLCSIIDKTLQIVDIGRIERNWSNMTFDYTAKLANMRANYLLFSAVILLIILAMLILLFLKTKRLSKDLERQTVEAKVASKAKSAFLAHMSHEIRTPLNAIIGMSQIAKTSINNTDKAIASIDQIIYSSNHLVAILNDVLDMSKIESGKMEIIYEPFSLLGAYNEVAAIINQRCYEKNISFLTNMNDMKDICIIGDKLRINQVLINLLGNAVKFTNHNGTIEFYVHILNEDDDSIMLRYSVIDNGIGMSEKQLSKLFIPFEQTDSSISAKFGGTGLGLSISQNLVNMMNGQIKVESKKGKGSAFTFELQFIKGDVSADTEELPVKKIDFSGKRILIVEDVDINRFIMRENLIHTNADIIEAENGQEAVELFGKSGAGYIDLIFMDIQMPVLNGYDATKTIRSMSQADAESIPIVAMTANAYKEDIEESFASGMNEHLTKPVNKDEIMKVLLKYLG